ncbi:hypothetical protein [Hydrocarboniphaga sp.]|uniref:hypothetical protein n=1 Tax=Hydrocarboniphaga sp. TaxID=2033016 RepID=UPI003D11543D
MSKIAAQTFKGSKVKLDGTLFEDCAFEGCTLVYAGGELPQFVGCSFNNIQFVLDGAAARSAAYIRMTYKAGAANVVRDWLPELFLSKSQH